MAGKPVDFNKISGMLQEHEERAHIDDLTEMLEKTVNFKGHRKLKVEEAEKLGNQIYDKIADYLAGYYGHTDKTGKQKISKKGKFNDSLLENAVRGEFQLDRAELVGNLKIAAQNGQSFSSRYIKQLLDRNIGHYHGEKLRAIMKDLDVTHKPYIQDQIKGFIKNHKLDESKYKAFLDKSADLELVKQGYQNLAAEFYKKKK